MKNALIAVFVVGVLTLFGYTIYQSNQDTTQTKQAFETFQKEVSQQNKPVAILFKMKDCPSCATFEPRWEAVKGRHQGQCEFQTTYWQGEDPHRLQKYFSVESFPTIIFLDAQGQVKGKDSGDISEEVLEKEVSKLIAQSGAKGTT